jgi:hypothetical protein
MPLSFSIMGLSSLSLGWVLEKEGTIVVVINALRPDGIGPGSGSELSFSHPKPPTPIPWPSTPDPRHPGRDSTLCCGLVLLCRLGLMICSLDIGGTYTVQGTSHSHTGRATQVY